jgi:hypothetical protein
MNSGDDRWLTLENARALLHAPGSTELFAAEMRLKEILRSGQDILRWADSEDANDRPDHRHLVRTKFRFEQGGLAFDGEEDDWEDDCVGYRPLLVLGSALKNVIRSTVQIPVNENHQNNAWMTLVEVEEWIRRAESCDSDEALRSLKQELDGGRLTTADWSKLRADAHYSETLRSLQQEDRRRLKMFFDLSRSRVASSVKIVDSPRKRYSPIALTVLNGLEISLYGPGFLVPLGKRIEHEAVVSMRSTEAEADSDFDAEADGRDTYQILALVDRKEVAKIWPLESTTFPARSTRGRGPGRPGLKDEIFGALEEVSRTRDVDSLNEKQLSNLVTEHLGKRIGSKNLSPRTLQKHLGNWKNARKTGRQ